MNPHLPNPNNPRREPARRWHRAGYLLDTGRWPSPHLDDETIAAARDFRRALTGPGVNAVAEATRCWPAVAEAHGIHAGADAFRRWELEARLLGNNTDDAIAARLGLSVDGVRRYHDLFYDVRPCLVAEGYVLNVLLGGRMHRDVRADDYELFIKVIGYTQGGRGVDAFLAYLANPPVVPADLGGLDLAALKDLRDRFAFKVALLTMATPASALTPETWLRLSSQRSAAQAAECVAPDGVATVLASIRSMVTILDELARAA